MCQRCLFVGLYPSPKAETQLQPGSGCLPCKAPILCDAGQKPFLSVPLGQGWWGETVGPASSLPVSSPACPGPAACDPSTCRAPCTAMGPRAGVLTPSGKGLPGSMTADVESIHTPATVSSQACDQGPCPRMPPRPAGAQGREGERQAGHWAWGS